GGRLIVSIMFAVMSAAVEAQEEIKYFEIGGSLVVDPKVSYPITSLTWKHNGNIQAEWIKDVIPLEYFGDFKGRSEVNLTTGELTISNMLKADEGTFNMEINGRELPGRFRVVGVKNLHSVMVEVMTPAECTRASLNCTLECGGDFSDAGPVQYFWKKGETGPWEENEKTITIPNPEETLCFKSFSCKAKNPVSEKESNPAKNPFTRDP
uniref:Ig-like domain-containing protein n=1 Tax=Fundulus heteroclitus TaxID=8078 RepID=A0A3Q2PE71_FUNHE